MTSEQVESDYYRFREFDLDNARTALSHYVQFFPAGPVLELACGPGTFLELLTERGISCEGVDVDDGMVAQVHERGCTATLGDAVEYLRTVAPNSLAGLFAAHFVEHLSAEHAQEIYTEAARVLVPGGVFVAAVPNPASLSILTADFWKDPTHVRPYDPVALEFFARQAGLIITAVGANPLNDPGPPPGLTSIDNVAVSNLEAAFRSLVLDIQKLVAPRSRWQRNRHREAITTVVDQLQHLFLVLNNQALTLNHQIADLQSSNHALVQHLYPPNEVYVIAAAPALVS